MVAYSRVGRLLTFWAFSGRLFEVGAYSKVGRRSIELIEKLLVGRWPLSASGIGLQAVVVRLS